MDKLFIIKTKEIIKKIERINNQTPNKIDELMSTLIEYDTLIHSVENFSGYQIIELVQNIDKAKTKRVNVSKKYIHGEFKRIKEAALFRIKHNYSLPALNSEKTTAKPKTV